MDNIAQLRKKLLASIRNADHDYGLIEKGDRILVGLSGGKDSVAMLDLLSTYRRFADEDFELAAIHLDFGFPPVDFTPVADHVRSLGVPLIEYEAVEVYKILDENRNPANGLLPCSICSRMRKAIVNRAAKQYGFKKVAFAHHMDDAIETLFLNMTHGARIATFEPKMYLENVGITFIRPLINAREKQIARYVQLAGLPVCKNSCGNDDHTQRKVMKELLNDYYERFPDSYSNFAVMLSNYETFQLFFDKRGIYSGDGTKIKRCFTGADMLDVASVAKEDMQDEDFSHSGCIYYLLSEHDEPLAYLKLREDHEDFHVDILSLHYNQQAREGQLIRFISTVENDLSMHHVPREIIFHGYIHQEIFSECGYDRSSDDEMMKMITRARKA